jgi:hypothetical protein
MMYLAFTYSINLAGVILYATVAQLLANQEAQARVYDQNLVALSQHYQQVHAEIVGYFWSQMPGSQEPPPSIFAPPPVPVPIPVHAPGPILVSILVVALTCAAIHGVLIT